MKQLVENGPSIPRADDHYKNWLKRNKKRKLYLLKDTDDNGFEVGGYDRPAGGLTHEMWLEKKAEDK